MNVEAIRSLSIETARDTQAVSLLFQRLRLWLLVFLVFSLSHPPPSFLLVIV